MMVAPQIVSPTPTIAVNRRQLWALPTPTDLPITTGLCKTLTLPAGGSLTINNISTITFSSNVIYQPPCTGSPAFFNVVGNATEPIDQYKDPFYASVTPLVYVVALTTALAWMIFIILLLLPASYQGLGSRPLNRRWHRGDDLRSLFASRSSPFPIGYRPWLQRFAALMVVMALTTVTTDTFRHAEDQYINGYSDANTLKNEVTGSIEVRVIRVISDLFLWLAQIQTLIRLFPRRKEKLVIKWVGFFLILLDIIFSCLNTFYIDVSTSDNHPRSYRDAIPALSYLFQLALNLLYAAWVGYFVMTKRRYAFYHSLMPEIFIIACIASLSLLIPVVFFLVDILQPDVGAWGDYFRWLGSAAASIVVWEWVERIELLEREEKKDGILGREIFEEDDLSDSATPYIPRRDSFNGQEKEFGETQRYQGIRAGYDKFGSAVRHLTVSQRPRERDERQVKRNVEYKNRVFRKRRARRKENARETDDQLSVTVPPPVVSPVDRAEAISPSDTIYAVRYHKTTQTPPIPEHPTVHNVDSAQPGSDSNADDSPGKELNYGESFKEKNALHNQARWLGWISNAFQRSRNSPPVEVKKALGLEKGEQHRPSGSGRSWIWRLVNSMASKTEPGASSPLNTVVVPTVIPPPTNGNYPWTPDRIRLATHPPTPVQPTTQLDQQQGVISRGQSAAYDFAVPLPSSPRVANGSTHNGTSSGSTVVNSDSPNANRGSWQDGPSLAGSTEREREGEGDDHSNVSNANVEHGTR